MSDYFVLTEDKRCVPCEDPMEWAKAWGHKRIVKQDRLHRYNFLRYFGFPQPPTYSYLDGLSWHKPQLRPG